MYVMVKCDDMDRYVAYNGKDRYSNSMDRWRKMEEEDGKV